MTDTVPYAAALARAETPARHRGNTPGDGRMVGQLDMSEAPPLTGAANTADEASNPYKEGLMDTVSTGDDRTDVRQADQ